MDFVVAHEVKIIKILCSTFQATVKLEDDKAFAHVAAILVYSCVHANKFAIYLCIALP